MFQLPDQYKNLREEQAKLESQRLTILFSSSTFTALSAVISQVTKDHFLSLLLQLFLLISLIWGLSMYKSLSSQIFKTITYNIKYLEKSLKNKWLEDSMKFADKFPPVPRFLKKWTHVFTLLTIMSIIFTWIVCKSTIANSTFIKSQTNISPWMFVCLLLLFQVIEVYMCIKGVFYFDHFHNYIKNWKVLKPE